MTSPLSPIPAAPLHRVLVHGEEAHYTIMAHGRKLTKGPGDCGVDLYPAIVSPEEIRWKALGFFSLMMIPTRVTVSVPQGYFGLVIGRSSSYDRLLGCQVIHGIIDHGYTGEYLIRVQVPLMTEGHMGLNDSLVANVYECAVRKIALAQVILIPFLGAKLEESFALPLTTRGHNGYGSTDVSKMDLPAPLHD